MNLLRLSAKISFSLFLILSLNTPSWRYGPFSRWPVAYYYELAGAPVKLGILNLLPPIILLGCLLEWRAAGRWHWGRPIVTIPFAAFTLWALIRLDWNEARLTFIYTGAFFLAWLVYFYTLNRRPSLTFTLSVVVVVQSLVGIGQFLQQRDLGLVFLGELPLNPAFEGVTVLSARNTHWLRAYGLTAHPNLLGAMLAVLLVLLLPALANAHGKQRALLLLIEAIGLVGLFFSFSRAAWLALGLGFFTWFLMRGSAIVKQMERRRPSDLVFYALPLLAILLFFFAYRDLAFSRFLNLDKPIEARSIQRRIEDATLALQLISDRPLLGTGLGYYRDVASTINEDAERVHNVPLLVGAELGIPGLIIALSFFLLPLWQGTKSWGSTERAANHAQHVAPWVVTLVVNQFDTMLWVTSNWQTAILFGLIAATLAHERQDTAP